MQPHQKHPNTWKWSSISAARRRRWRRRKLANARKRLAPTHNRPRKPGALATPKSRKARTYSPLRAIATSSPKNMQQPEQAALPPATHATFSMGSDGIPVFNTGDAVRDAVLKQATTVLGARDNETEDSKLQTFLTRQLPQSLGLPTPKLANGTALPATGNDICGLTTSAIYAAALRDHNPAMLPYSFEGHQRVAAIRRLNPAALHKYGDGYTPQPGDMFIANYSMGSHAGIVVGSSKAGDNGNLNLYTIDSARVIRSTDGEHHMFFSQFHIDSRAQQLARNDDGILATRYGTDNIFFVDISKLPGYEAARKKLSTRLYAPMQFPSSADPSSVRAEQHQKMASIIPTLEQFQPRNQVAAAAPGPSAAHLSLTPGG